MSVRHKRFILNTAVYDRGVNGISDNERKKIKACDCAQKNKKAQDFSSFPIVFNRINAGGAEDGPKAVGKDEEAERKAIDKLLRLSMSKGQPNQAFDELLNGKKHGKRGKQKLFSGINIFEDGRAHSRQEGACGEACDGAKTHKDTRGLTSVKELISLTLTAFLPMSKSIAAG